MFQDKVAIVTGGARGMGGATSRLFVEHGAKVVIADVLDADGEKLASELGESAIFVHHDVSDELRAMLAKAQADLKTLYTSRGDLPDDDILLAKNQRLEK